jgi:hypothetical protein
MAKFDLALDGRDAALRGPSAWEQFLLGVGVAESNCSSLLAGHSQKGRAIRSWVHENYVTRYVPEYVLSVLGLQRRLKGRWPDGE